MANPMSNPSSSTRRSIGSVPPGARRPTTPSDSARRDEIAGASRGSDRSAFDPGLSRGDASSTRSRSVTGSKASRSTGNPHREGLNSGGSSGSTTCDKCDGKHPTERCPHFQKDREKHKDAWVNYGCKNNPHQMGGSGGNFVLRNARVIPQPGDGSCLYHSLSYGLRTTNASTLRHELARFLKDNPKLEIAGDTLEEWVRWDSNNSVNEYARRQAVSGWGGGIEMACCSTLKHVNIHVYESMGRYSAEFKRISCFDNPNADKTIHVLYQGGLHYDALQAAEL